MPSVWGVTPRQSVEGEVERVGLDSVVSQCIAVLVRAEAADGFLLVIGGPGAHTVLDGREGGVAGYWPKAWALRALLYAWQDRAAPAVLDAITDPSWRVRELAARVIGRHRIDAGLDALMSLVGDPIARVRRAGVKAREQLTSAVK